MTRGDGDVRGAVTARAGSPLITAARAAVASTLHGGKPLGVRARDLLLRTVVEDTGELPHDEQPLVLAGMILARARDRKSVV